MKLLVAALTVVLAFACVDAATKCYVGTQIEDDGTDTACTAAPQITTTPAAVTSWSCYLISKDNGTKWDRGCTVEARDVLCTRMNVTATEYCGVCAEDLCNDSTAIASIFSLTVLGIAAIKMLS